MGKLVGGDDRTGVVDGKYRAVLFLFVQLYCNAALRAGVLHSVVDERPDEAFDLNLVSSNLHVVLDVLIELDVCFEGHGVKGQARLLCEGRQVNGLLLAVRTCACTALVVSCKEEQLFDETLHVHGFVFDAAYPFHLLGDLGLRMCCDDVRVGENDSERCLELVRCVGDELRLLVPGAFDGPGNEMGEQYAHEGHGNQRESEDGQDSHHSRLH